MAVQSDVILLAQIAEGDLRAFEQLMLRYENRVFQFCLKLLKSAELAEEVTQDAFIKIWESRDELTSLESVPAWLHSVSRNRALNVLKEQASRYAREAGYASVIDQLVDGHSEIQLRDLQRQINMLVEKLPPKRREIYRLKTEEGLSNEDIGERLRISPNTVKNQLNKAYQTLRQLLAEFVYLLLICYLFF